MLARARPQGDVDQAADAKKEQAAKQDRLKSAEAVDDAASQVGVSAASEEGMLTGVTRLMGRQSVLSRPDVVKNRGQRANLCEEYTYSI